MVSQTSNNNKVKCQASFSPIIETIFLYKCQKNIFPVEIQSAHCASCFILQICGEQQQSELQVVVNALRGQLEVAREQLRRGGEQKICLQALLERRVQEERESQELLREKDEELQLRQQENQQVMNRVCVWREIMHHKS